MSGEQTGERVGENPPTASGTVGGPPESAPAPPSPSLPSEPPTPPPSPVPGESGTAPGLDIQRRELEQERRQLELDRRDLEIERRRLEQEREAADQQQEEVHRVVIDPNEHEPPPTPPAEPETITERKRHGIRWQTRQVPKT